MTEARLRLYFDGECPLCAREVAFMRRRDSKKAIDFVDIASRDFRAESEGLELRALMDEIHAKLPDGTIVTGVEVFRRVYSLLGFGPLVAASRLPLVRGALDLLYRLWAKNRLKLTGRCSDSACAV